MVCTQASEVHTSNGVHLLSIMPATSGLGKNGIHRTLTLLLDGAADVFGSTAREEPVDLAPLHAKIGQLALENDFLESALTKAGLLSALA